MPVQGLEAQLLAEVVRREAGYLDASKDKLVLSLSADTRQLQELQARILKLLKVGMRSSHRTCKEMSTRAGELKLASRLGLSAHQEPSSCMSASKELHNLHGKISVGNAIKH